MEADLDDEGANHMGIHMQGQTTFLIVKLDEQRLTLMTWKGLTP